MRFPSSRLAVAVIFAALLGIAALAQTGSRGFDPANMCTTCNACEDFYTYANGGWLAKNEIPAAFSVWGTTSNLREKNIGVLRQILEDADKNTTAPAGSNERKIGDTIGQHIGRLARQLKLRREVIALRQQPALRIVGEVRRGLPPTAPAQLHT